MNRGQLIGLMGNSKIRSIYKSQNARIQGIFERAQSPRTVLCVAIDYAKAKHVALICDGNGDILKNPFTVLNSPEGVAFLLDEIAATARRRKIPKTQIILGGEDIPSYVDNFILALKKSGIFVARVNAAEAKLNRENSLASTDQLDLLGIAKTLLSRRARSAGDPLDEGENLYLRIRDLSRTRRQLVKQKTACSNRIHTLSDRLFPGYLNASSSVLNPFSPPCLDLMKERFSAPQIASRKPESLAKFLRKYSVHHPDEKAAKLITLARNALPPAADRVFALQQSLTASAELYLCLDRNAQHLKLEAANALLQTPYAMLTSVGGVGLTLAAGLAGELGDPKRLGGIDSLCGYAGIVPRSAQTGGPDKTARQGGTSPKCNRVLKDWLVQASQKVALYGPDEWKQRHARWQVGGQHAAFAGAKRLLRLTRTMTRQQIPWMSAAARAQNASRETRARDAEATFEILVHKWRTLPDWQELVFAPDRPLGFWRKLSMEMHGAQLPLRGDE